MRTTARTRRGTAAIVLLALSLLAACSGSGGGMSRSERERRAAAAKLPLVPEPVPADLQGRTVALFGDSLITESQGALQRLATANRYRLRIHARSGATPCDGTGPLADELAKPAKDRPDVVILAYAGNTWLYSPCFGTEGQTTRQAVARYRMLLESMVDDATAAGVKVGVLGGPAWPGNDLAPLVFDIERAVATEHDVPFVDGGEYVTPHRTWTDALPCRADEPVCDDGIFNPHLTGTAVAQDVHFDCDDPDFAVGRNRSCPVYSGGSFRYAVSIDRLIQDAAADP